MAKAHENKSEETSNVKKKNTGAYVASDAEKLKHGKTSKDETGAPKGKDCSNASDQTS
jgi:hypothetical protein